MKVSQRSLLQGLCFIAALAGVAVCAAAQQPTAAPAKPPAKEAAGAPQLPMKEFMFHVIQYSAQNVWSKQGWITDKAGQRSLFPKNDQEWEDAESACLTLSEIITLLMQPGRRVDVPGWDASVLQVRKTALQAADAALKHDEAAFFRFGTAIDEACEGCHRAVGIVK